MNTTIKQIYDNKEKYEDQQVRLQGWIRNNRDQKNFGFINLSDGTSFNNIQIVYNEDKIDNFKEVAKLLVGSAIEIEGTLILTPEMRQPFEVQATKVILLGNADETYPIQPKRHTREFLRTVSHLRPRTNLFQAVFRVRSVAAFTIHEFFQEKGFVYAQTPIITTNDGEGAGEMFNVTTFNPEKEIPKTKEGKIDYSKDFFANKTHLTVTGQLEGEAMAMAFRNIYTFGPTFRAENSNTTKHASEFWMIEPEIAFADLGDLLILAEDMVKYVVQRVIDKCPDEFAFFEKFVSPGLMDKLNHLLNSKFHEITHHEAITILLNSKKKFEHLPTYDGDLSTEHEKYLTEEHFNTPVFVTNWPKDIKAFYMKLNEDGKTVAAMDLLVPKAGELIGGSQREDRLDLLEKRMDEMNIPKEDLWWYLDLRRYGGAVHSGFGLGFERLLMYLTGVENIRDVILFPRTPDHSGI